MVVFVALFLCGQSAKWSQGLWALLHSTYTSFYEEACRRKHPFICFSHPVPELCTIRSSHHVRLKSDSLCAFLCHVRLTCVPYREKEEAKKARKSIDMHAHDAQTGENEKIISRPTFPFCHNPIGTTERTSYDSLLSSSSFFCTLARSVWHMSSSIIFWSPPPAHHLCCVCVCALGP